MFVVENLAFAVAKIIDVVLTLYMWLIIFRALISWVNPDPYNPIVRFLYRATEPVLAPVRRILPFGGLGVDISPIVVLLVIYFLQLFLVRTIMQAAVYLR
ncbi:MAG TPA: YggT family protein [Syntrophales bacterium]|nr:YggT family protein [Syntrophales bacterium]HOM08207.1 YggT family protein [Syntrophales bacterium]HOO00856.1 YggT family protein [Syntrophales bacterium]HPC02087.1 YggT family protein [Syntrophales bacterium]HPQ07084.1 YggT family protein [Syntrophales bacterium]